MFLKDQFGRINVTENVRNFVQILMRRLPSTTVTEKNLQNKL